MTGIKIPVEASFDRGNSDQVLQQFQASINKLGGAVAQANKVQYKPIDKATLDDLKKVTASFENLRKVSGDLNKRMKATGQSGASFTDVNWDKLYPDANSRSRQMQKSFEYVMPGRFTGLSAGGGGNGSGGGGGGSGGPPNTGGGGPQHPGPGRQILGAGLSAMGPAGGVANSAITRGMSGGLGAGMMGLAGGLAALAVGAVVSKVREKVSAAEAENVGYDPLKRALGDVNIGFNALKETLRTTANGLGMTFDESQKLGVQFTKLSGLSGDQAKTVAEEVNIAGGAGRALGLDPSTTNAFFAQMRQSGATKDTQGSRELALLIGESVAKSGGAAKSEELLSQIANFSALQARTALTGGNTQAFTSLLGGMMGSKLPGMDPANAGALLGRMNSAVASGGAMGEAGQNFLYSALGRGGQLDPLQVKLLQEQGMFGTGASTFGAGSVYAGTGGGATGLEGSNTTNYELIKQRFEKMYGGNKLLSANAQSNFFGINMTQAMAMNSMKPQELGGVQSRLGRLGIDMKDVNATGIQRMGNIEANKSLSSAEKDQQMRVAATEGQEKNMGSDIRDSKARLENIQQSLADKLVPLTQSMRDGILYLAGGGKKSGREVMEDIARANSKDRVAQIKDKFSGPYDAAKEDALKAKSRMIASGTDFAERNRQKELMEAAEREQDRIKLEQQKELAAESANLTAELKKLNEQLKPTDTGAAPAIGAGAGRGSHGAGAAAAGGKNTDQYDDLYKAAGAKYGVDWKLLKATAMQESGQNPGVKDNVNPNGRGYDAGIMQHNSRYFAERGLTDATVRDPKTAIDAGAKLMSQIGPRVGFDPRKMAARWNGSGPAADLHAERVMRNYALLNGTPMPDGHDAKANANAHKVSVSGTASVDVNVNIPGQQRQSIPVQTKLAPARAAGAF